MSVDVFGWIFYFMYEREIHTKSGENVLTYEYVDALRTASKGKNNPLQIIAQRGCQEKFLSTNADITIFGGNRGGPLMVDTRVVTPFGYRRIGDLKAGDIISATDGGMQRVVYRQDHGLLPSYRLTFVDGSSVIASSDHLWNVKVSTMGNWITITTEQIIQFMDIRADVYIPICGRIKTAEDMNLRGASEWPAIDDRIFAIESIKWELDDSCNFLYRKVDTLEEAEHLKFLIDSLGGLATINKENLTVSRVAVANINANRLRMIKKYEYVGEKECCCIAVDNTNSLFMVEDFIVTHNSKSFSLLMESLKDVTNQFFNATLLRKEKDDLLDLVYTSYMLYGQHGTYNKSINDMTWNFNKGGKLKFSYYSDSFEDFKKRFQGKQFSYIGIDEITHCSYDKFKYLITCNRNAYGIRNRFYGTCNPDPDSWVRKFIDWWIGEDGLPIPERDGVIRYCFMDGDTPDSIYWGNTPEEVYEQCKGIIDPLWNDAFAELGFNKITMFVKSVTFIKGKLEENIALISSDPNYVANLAQQDEEQRSRDLEGNWNFKATGDDIIKMDDMERFYALPQLVGGKRYASCDIAFEGGDSLVMWLWVGWHIQDIFVCRADAKSAIDSVRAKLAEWGVLEEDFTYDLNGLGQTFKGFFKRAVPFNNRESVDVKLKYVYDTLKSQSAYLFAKKVIAGEVSINPRILDLKFSGKGFENVPLRQILMKERKCIRADENAADKGFCLIKKSDMKKIVGHSPDYFESLFMRMIFDIKKTKHARPKGIPKLIRNPYSF